MQKRHTDQQQYFNELSATTEKYILPLISAFIVPGPGVKVAEVGCGLGGNLEPFLDKGCSVYGIDRDAQKTKHAKKLLDAGERKNAHVIQSDFFLLEETEENRFDIILLRDTIEHIHDKNKLLQKLKTHLLPGGIIYIAFPPWRMPFGGHHQVCVNGFISKLPYFHLLPSFMYFGIMKMLGEQKSIIRDLRECRETGISIAAFRSLIKRNRFATLKEITYFINPHYEAKFKLKPRLLPRSWQIPWLADFYATAHSCIVRPE